MDFFNQLQSETETERQEFMKIPVIQQTMGGEVSIETYRAFLTEAYHHVKHTVPLLMSCGGRLQWPNTFLKKLVTRNGFSMTSRQVVVTRKPCVTGSPGWQQS